MYTEKLDVDDLQLDGREFNGSAFYAHAKRVQVVLTELLDSRLGPFGVSVHAMHPGWVDTPGVVDSLPRFHSTLGRILRTPDQGADTIVWLAGSDEAAEHGGKALDGPADPALPPSPVDPRERRRPRPPLVTARRYGRHRSLRERTTRLKSPARSAADAVPTSMNSACNTFPCRMLATLRPHGEGIDGGIRARRDDDRRAGTRERDDGAQHPRPSVARTAAPSHRSCPDRLLRA